MWTPIFQPVDYAPAAFWQLRSGMCALSWISALGPSLHVLCWVFFEYSLCQSKLLATVSKQI